MLGGDGWVAVASYPQSRGRRIPTNSGLIAHNDRG